MRKTKKTLSSEELEFLKIISDNEILIFNFEQIKNMSKLNPFELQDILTICTKKEILFRVEKGLYCVRNFRNPFVIGNALIEDSAIGYWSALNLHKLTEQIPNTVYIQSPNRKKNKKVFNVRYKFIQVKQEKVNGITQMGYGNEQFRITNIEKTLLDCFDLPQHSGGYEELIRAFYNAKTSSLRLLDYGKKMGNLSVLKRMAFLSELYEMKGFTRFQNGVLKLMNKKYSLLDPMGENTGEFNSKWRIRINLSKENLLEMIQKTY